MNNVQSLQNEYMKNNPDEVLVSNRLNQMIQFYGREIVFKNMITEKQDDEVQRHLKNLVACYGAGTLKAVAMIIFNTELNKRRKTTKKAV